MDEFDFVGTLMDELIKETEINLTVTMPKGTTDVEIRTTFNNKTVKDELVNWYILLQANAKAVKDIYNMDMFKKSKLEEMVDGVLEQLKGEIMEECKNG